jgi:hypothetical protein
MHAKASQTQLSGWKLVLARTGWITLFVMDIAIYLIALPFRMAELRLDPYLLAEPLHQLGLTVEFFVLYSTLLEMALFTAVIVIALIIFWRKSDDWMGLLVSIGQFSLIVLLPVISVLPNTNPGWRIPVGLIRALGASLALLIFYLFPDGHFSPRWTRWLFILFCGITFTGTLSLGYTPPAAPIDIGNSTDALLILILLAWFGTGTLSQVYRFRTCKDPLQRQQTKWIVFGFSAVFLGLALITFPILLFPALRVPGTLRLLYLLIDIPLTLLALSILPITIGISILKYRLWDIDILIRRTLVYTLLSLLLGIFYFGAVVVLTQIFSGLSGQENSPLAIVLSTLAIAALFSPLRGWIQNNIDRRFYRHKYNAQQALIEFTQTAREDVSMERLTLELLNTVKQTMQPNHVHLWLLHTGIQKSDIQADSVNHETDEWRVKS